MKAALHRLFRSANHWEPISFLKGSLSSWHLPSHLRAPSSVLPAACAPPTPTVALVLSSGAAKGLAHIGVIEVLEENHIPVSIVAGSSMGAYVGGLWAGGQSASQLHQLASLHQNPLDRLDLIDPAFPPRRGFIHGHRIAKRLRHSLSGARIEDLEKDLYIVATELDSFRRRVFHEGDLVDAIRASIAIPGILVPVTLDGVDYIDGGISDPLPVDVVRDKADVVIAVSVVPTVAELEVLSPTHPAPEIPPSVLQLAAAWLNQHLNYFARGNLLDILRRAAFASQVRLIEGAARQADVFIQASLPGAGWHDYHHAETYIAHGRKIALEALPAIQNLVAKTPARLEQVPLRY